MVITIDAACSFKETLRVLNSKTKRALFALNSRFELKKTYLLKLPSSYSTVQ